MRDNPAVTSEFQGIRMRSTISRLVLALAVAAVVAIVQAWGWGDAVRTLAAAAGWLWRVSWPIVRVAALPLTVAWVVYVTTSARWRRWWRAGPWRAAGRYARRGWVPLSVAGTVVLLAGLVLLLAPSWLVGHDTAPGTLIADQRAKATSDARTALLQAVGGLLLAAGALATWRQVRISREGQVTERFTRAVDQLGSEHLDVRLGGLYALERIARDSPGDRRTIAEILTAYTRQRALWPPTQPGQYRADWPLDQQPDLRTRAPDVQAALTVLGRGPFPKPTDPYAPHADRLDLPEVDLRKAELDGAHLEGALLSGAHLEGASLDGADLEGALLGGVHLEGASLVGADLEGALLVSAHLERAFLIAANLKRARLEGADLKVASLLRADLKGAWLEDADLRGASLVDADLRGAWLDGADLKATRASAATVWPEGFRWRDAGIIRLDDLLGEPTGTDDEATAATTAAVGETELGTAAAPEREDRPPDTARTGSDGDGEPGSPSHHG
jgi:hypothetical protein